MEAARQIAERLRDRERRNEHGDHRDRERPGEHAAVGAGVVAEPAVGRPGEPQQHEHADRLHDAERGVRLRHQVGDLGEPEDVDEVEEQLEGRDAVTRSRRSGTQTAGQRRHSSSASSFGSSSSLELSSSTLTSLNVSTRTDFTKRSER